MQPEDLEIIERESFRAITLESSRFDRNTGDVELGAFVRGVVALESLLYAECHKDKGE